MVIIECDRMIVSIPVTWNVLCKWKKAIRLTLHLGILFQTMKKKIVSILQNVQCKRALLDNVLFTLIELLLSPSTCVRRTFSTRTIFACFLVRHLIDTHPLVWARETCKHHFNPVFDPKDHIPPRINIRHPRFRWDDYVRSFCWKTWPQHYGRHWFAILSR